MSSLTVNETPIRIIEDWTSLKAILPNIASAQSIGIDSEWKPQYLAKIDEFVHFFM